MSGISGGGSDLFTKVATVPAHSSSTGTPYQIVWDAQGNLYICYQTNTWARYTDVFAVTTIDSQPLGMP